MRFTPIICLLILLTDCAYCQNRDSTDLFAGRDGLINDISNKTLDRLAGSYNNLNASVDKQSMKLLRLFQKKESALKKEIQRQDSAKAMAVFANGKSACQKIMSKLNSSISDPLNSFRNYIPGIDSMKTAIAFLGKTGLSVEKLQKFQSIDEQLKQLRGSFQNANDIQDYVTQRTAQLTDMLKEYSGVSRGLMELSKQTYYYQQQLAEYKSVLNDNQKQQQLILTAIKRVPAFQRFWQKNSLLAELFPTPGNSGTVLAGTGLQTNAQVGKLIQEKLGTSMQDGGANAAQFLKQRVSGSQGQLNLLQQKLSHLSMSGGNNSMTLPDFTPDGQRHKSFLKRLEYGFNIQNTNSTSLLPSISNIGLSAGYKINDKATVGFGLNYLLGWGSSLSHIRLSNQGIGLRPYFDIKARGSIWITGGYEYRYMQQFAG
ncbi:MAG TPA: hypothetical protein VK588_02735, partial [Chitinophagaceae bacterium]|nr:hypothetical protein [Chitinophagaceae bacterium]